MRLLLICHEFPPIGGGAATVAASLAQAIAAERDVTVLTSRYPGLARDEMQGRVRVRRVRALRRATFGATPLEMIVFTLSALVAAVRLCRRERFHGCLAIQGIPAAWVAMPLASLCRLPYAIALVGADVPGFLPERFDRLHRYVAWLTRRTWRRAAAVTANSQSLTALAERTARPLGVSVETVLYGVDVTVHQPPAAPRAHDVVRFLFVGRLSTQKGIRFLVDAVVRARDELRGRATIVVVGDGEDGAAMQARARAEVLEGVLEFRGWLSREDLASCYREASVFVLPSLDEGRSQAALEAMASGLAVIASDIVGNAGLVEEGVNGLLVPPRDAEALAAALVTMVDLGPAKLTSMGDASRARVGRFSWRDAASRYLLALDAAVVGDRR